MTNFKTFAMIAIALLMFSAPGFGQATPTNTQTTVVYSPTNPTTLSGGGCLPTVWFENGTQNSLFGFTALPNGLGFLVNWHVVTKLKDGFTPAFTGVTFTADGQFHYQFNWIKGSYINPQRSEMTLKSSTGNSFKVTQMLAVRYDDATNTLKMVVEKTEVDCKN
jgi:hypothetical protein